MPCDPNDNDELPHWVRSFGTKDVGLDVLFNVLNEELGIGKITIRKENMEIGHVPNNQPFYQMGIQSSYEDNTTTCVAGVLIASTPIWIVLDLPKKY